eukprot:2072533-Pleurochrysis_carterae.AAC.1
MQHRAFPRGPPLQYCRPCLTTLLGCDEAVIQMWLHVSIFVQLFIYDILAPGQAGGGYSAIYRSPACPGAPTTFNKILTT